MRTLPHTATAASSFQNYIMTSRKDRGMFYFPHLRLFSEPRNITLDIGTFRLISHANGDTLLPVCSRLHRKHMELKIILHNPNGWNNESTKGKHIKRNALWENTGRSKGRKVTSSCSAHLSGCVSSFRRLHRLCSQNRIAHEERRTNCINHYQFNTTCNYVTPRSTVLLEKLTGP
jgi:hypothetical protein